MKTNGQRLYELKNPKLVEAIRLSDRHFPTSAGVFLVDNQSHAADWDFLTKACKQSWEDSAIGHNLLSDVEQAST